MERLRKAGQHLVMPDMHRLLCVRRIRPAWAITRMDSGPGPESYRLREIIGSGDMELWMIAALSVAVWAWIKVSL